jgi:hypothetical protein
MSMATSITVRVPLTVRHRPGRKTVVTLSTSADTAAIRTRADPAMMKALARAFRGHLLTEMGVPFAGLDMLVVGDRNFDDVARDFRRNCELARRDEGVSVVHKPAKQASGRSSAKANQIGGLLPFGNVSFSEKLVNGTMHRLSTPSHRRQCGDAVLRTFVTPGSLLRPFSAKTGDGIPHRAMVSSRPASVFHTIGAA